MKRRQKHVDKRRGPLSLDEKKKIEVMAETKSDEEIATLLKRSVKQIATYKNDYMSNAPVLVVKRSEAEEFKRELHAQADWSEVERSFTPTEILFYENDYVNYRQQFKDMTATELKQLHHLITLDILMGRHMQSRMKTEGDTERLERLLRQMYDRPESEQNIDMIANMESQIQACRSASNAKTKEYKDLLDKHQSLLKDLKSTRDQRIKNLEDRGKFVVFLKQLEDEERRLNISEIIGLEDLGVEKERERLSQYHTYMDGGVDRPLLTPESVEIDDE